MNDVVHLTPRETEVLQQIARGCTYAQAASRLGISLHTITTHVRSSYYKLRVHSAGAAVMRAVELGFIGPEARGNPGVFDGGAGRPQRAQT